MRRIYNYILSCGLIVSTIICCDGCGLWKCRSGQPESLTVERRENPIGIDAKVPRLSWVLPPGVRSQGAYEIVATGWKSGKVVSSQSVDVEWRGPELRTGDRIEWRVRVWDPYGIESKWSEPSTFTMGVMKPEDWKAKWIATDPSCRGEVDLGKARWIMPRKGNRFSCKFNVGKLPTLPCELAYISKNGHSIQINGKNVALNHYEHFHDWRLVRTIDVARTLKLGENEIVATVTPFAGQDPALLLRLDLPDGKKLITGDRWGDVRVGGTLREIQDGDQIVSREDVVSPAFEKTFNVRSGLRRATLFVTGVGYYEARLNGVKIGDKVLDPSPTDYDKTVLYSTYHLEDMLRSGENTLRLEVGHGWYDIRSLEVWNFDTAPWRDFPRAIAQIELDYEDGTQTVITDDSWRQVQSSVLYDCIREAEVSGCAVAGDFNGANVAVVSGPKGILKAESQPGSKVVRTIAPVSIREIEGGCIVDFGENIAGWMRMGLKGLARGDVVSFTYDERLSADGMPCNDNDWFLGKRVHDITVGNPRHIDRFCIGPHSYKVSNEHAGHQRDRFVSAGVGMEIYEPKFMYHGFQYVIIRGLHYVPDIKDMTACVVSTDFADTGDFKCSDETFNTLMLFARRSYRANFANGFPTDCPHREKNGWTGDASIASRLAQYMFENTAAYEKWLGDIMDAQSKEGAIPAIVPTSGWGFLWGNGPVWDSALPFIAWTLWQYRGDRRILDVTYPAITKYLSFLNHEKMKDGLCDWGLDDWTPAKAGSKPAREYVSSCYVKAIAEIAAKIATIKGLKKEACDYRAMAASVRSAIRNKYRKGDGIWANGGQTAQSLALEFDICDDEAERIATKRNLVAAFAAADDHVTMGIVGMTHAFRALSSAGRADLAFKVLTQPTDPSPACWISKGGTSLWEDWTIGSSRNHIMFGDFAAWAYESLAGLRPVAPGWRELEIAPQPIGALEFVAASTWTPYGMARSAWQREGKKIVYRFTVPAGTMAVFRFPSGKAKKVGPGEHMEVE